MEWKAQATTLDAVGALTFGTFNLSGVDAPMRLSAVRATADVFGILGFDPDRGRAFRPDEDRRRGDHVVLLTNRFWRRQFAAIRMSLAGRCGWTARPTR